MSQKLAGIDVTVFNYQSMDSAGNLGGTTSLLGRWESIDIEASYIWFERTSSDALTPQKRPCMRDWNAQCKGLVDTAGSIAMLQLAAGPYVGVTFTEVNSGLTFLLKGGIDKTRYSAGQEKGTDELNLMEVGVPNSFTYAY